MPEKPIDLDALERVIGNPPPYYTAGDPRNSDRIAWWNRAVCALGKVLARNSDRAVIRGRRVELVGPRRVRKKP